MSKYLLRAITIALAATFIVLGGLSGPAAAHTRLEISAPANNEVLTEPAEAITLTFTEAVQPDFTQVAVTDSDGQSVSSGSATVDGPVVRQPVSISAEGIYVVAYRVVSSDGHPVTGQLAFTYSTGPEPRIAESSPTGSPQSTQEAPVAGEEDDSSTSEWSLWWHVIAFGAAVMGLQVGLLLFLRHRGGRHSDD